jgi:protein phosphatase 1 regulatory subunit 11
VHFAEEVVDNEELGRKKSKCCCQYHRPKAFDESSDEEGDSLDVLRGPPFSEGDAP